MISDLSGIKDELEELEVVARKNEDCPSELIDLFESRLSSDIPVLYGEHTRLPRQERWSALSSCYAVWSANKQLI
jgi:hypothetical protein